LTQTSCDELFVRHLNTAYGFARKSHLDGTNTMQRLMSDRCARRLVCSAAVLLCVIIPRSVAVAGTVDFNGSTIASLQSNHISPQAMYKKFPAHLVVHPGDTWELGCAVHLQGATGDVTATLVLDGAAGDQGVMITQPSATFTLLDDLHNNYTASERFALTYTGSDDPFVGHVDLVLTPSGIPAISMRIHLNVTDVPGFPRMQSQFSGGLSAPVADLTGDGNLEIVIPGSFDEPGLQAIDSQGNSLPGWPFVNTTATVLDSIFFTPALVDLEEDGQSEVIVLEWANHGSEQIATLYVLEASGQVRWQQAGEFLYGATPTIADLEGRGALDILVAGEGNLCRFAADGTRVSQWQVETTNAVSVLAPVVADVDGNTANGSEIVACSQVSDVGLSPQLYVWNTDGSLHAPIWPLVVERCSSAPTVVELDGDLANGREIVLAVDHDPNPPVDPRTGLLHTFTVFAWHGAGQAVAGWPYQQLRDPQAFADDRIVAPSSAGDLDGDGDYEVVVATYGQGDPANGNVFVFHHDGTLDPQWPQWAGIAQAPSATAGLALGDLDGDGRLEIVTGSLIGTHVFHDDGQPFAGFPRLGTEHFNQPMIADLDGDDYQEIVQLSLGHVVQGAGLYVWRSGVPAPTAQTWPRFRNNHRRTGAVHSNCGSNIDCDDGSPCTADSCAPAGCIQPPHAHGDVQPDGVADLVDVLCVLDAFQGIVSCAQAGVDLVPCDGLDGMVDVDDILAALDAFRGAPTCSCPGL
jgi:hypothetical protein